MSIGDIDEFAEIKQADVYFDGEGYRFHLADVNIYLNHKLLYGILRNKDIIEVVENSVEKKHMTAILKRLTAMQI